MSRDAKSVSEHLIFTDPIGYQLAKVEAMAQPSVHYEEELICPACGLENHDADPDDRCWYCDEVLRKDDAI